MAAQRPTITDSGGASHQIDTGDTIDPTYLPAGTAAETATTIGALINAAGAATPNDGDFVATAESGGLLKKITWTSVKAFLKTYFDTVYHRIGGTDVPITDGGTGASDASTARTNLGLGTIATQAASGVSISGGSITGITDLAIADGGTAASTAAAARANLGVPRTLFGYTASETTAGTTEESLYSDTIVANTLATNKDKILFEYSGVYAATSNVKRHRVYFAGNSIFDNTLGIAAGVISSNNMSWHIGGYIIRVSNTAVRGSVWLMNEEYPALPQAFEITGLDLASTGYVMDLSGRSLVAAGGLTAISGTVDYKPYTG